MAIMGTRAPPHDPRGHASLPFGMPVYGATAAILGAVGLAWGKVVNVWQPVPDGAAQTDGKPPIDCSELEGFGYDAISSV